MILVEQLTRKFGEAVAVEDLNLNIAAGQIVGFLGPNGAGKTTTIRVLVGLLRPTRGKVSFLIDGKYRDFRHDPQLIRSRMGFVPDTPYLYDKLTGREHLGFLGALHGIKPEQRNPKINHWLEFFNLAEVADQPVEGYSHGMRQKIVIAGALLHQPDFLVIDEPMVGLDPHSARLLKNILLEYAHQRGGAVFLSTHSLDVAEEVCDEVAIISKGRLISSGRVDQLKQSHARQDVRLEQVFLELTNASQPENSPSPL